MMIFDHRTYACKPGTVKVHMALYEKIGFAVQSKHLGKPVLYGTTEVGDVNTYVHVWAYKDLAERTAKRAALWADPAWLEYVKQSGDLGALIHQENKILIGTAFAHAEV
jgi:NIPSNAP